MPPRIRCCQALLPEARVLAALAGVVVRVAADRQVAVEAVKAEARRAAEAAAAVRAVVPDLVAAVLVEVVEAAAVVAG